jgi:hypothetical protein
VRLGGLFWVSGIAAFIVASAAWSAPDAPSSSALGDVVRKMRESASLPSFRLAAHVYSLDKGVESAAPSEEVTITVAGPRSRVDRIFYSSAQAGERQELKRVISIYDGRGYVKRTEFSGGKQPLAWQGKNNENGREIGALLFGGLTIAQLDEMEVEPLHFLFVEKNDSGLMEIRSRSRPYTTVLVDPSSGFLVKRVETRNDDGDLARVCDVVFKEEGGRWRPVEQRIDSLDEGALEPESVIRLERMEQDPPLDASLFRENIPAGARVMPASVSDAEVENARDQSGLEPPRKTAAQTSTSSDSEREKIVSVNLDENREKEARGPKGPWSTWSVLAAIAIGVAVGVYRSRRKR